MMPTQLVTAAVVTGLLLACTATEPPGATRSPQDGDPTAAVLESRALLGDPLVDLGDAVLALADAMGQARHGAARGPRMDAALDDVSDGIEAVRSAATTATAAAQAAPIEEAAAIVSQAAASAAEGADAAEDELRFLRRVAAIDTALLEAAEAWDRRGSQSQIRERLAGVAADLRGVRRQARRLQPVPAGCPVLQENRRTWARTVRRRTVRLQKHANSAGGRTFDELRASYRGLPFGEEARTADAEDQPCWEEHSGVAAAADVLRESVDALRDALS